MQDVETTGANTVVTNYGLGARGIDFIERVGSSTVTGFPIYDSHGNKVATLTRNGDSYSIGDQRSYDAWGGVRAQQNAGDPKLRYCANLGHKQDDESDLIYMRARYYEPTSGRFVSQDRALDGTNWFLYAAANPVQNVDPSGKWVVAFIVGAMALSILFGVATYLTYEYQKGGTPTPERILGSAVTGFVVGIGALVAFTFAEMTVIAAGIYLLGLVIAGGFAVLGAFAGGFAEKAAKQMLNPSGVSAVLAAVLGQQSICACLLAEMDSN